MWNSFNSQESLRWDSVNAIKRGVVSWQSLERIGILERPVSDIRPWMLVTMKDGEGGDGEISSLGVRGGGVGGASMLVGLEGRGGGGIGSPLVVGESQLEVGKGWTGGSRTGLTLGAPRGGGGTSFSENVKMFV